MTDTLAISSERTANGNLLKKAVHRSSLISVDGLLERLFTLAFSGLVYPQIWEDPEVDLAAMELQSHHHVVAIASGGCNILSYLSANPGRITAVDLNLAHVALCRLKIASLRHLPGWESYYRFFGEADQRLNLREYRTHLSPVLDDQTRSYWEGRGLSGRRRLSHFRRNIYARGLLGNFISLGHLVGRLYGQDISGLLGSRSLREQKTFFDAKIAPLFDRKMVRWITNRRASLFGLGIPPAQYDALAGGASMADVLKGRLEKLATAFPLRENYFAWQAFGKAYAPGAAGPLPPYLQERNYAQLRLRADKIRVDRISFNEALARMPEGAVDRFVLLDAQDWMTDRQLNELWNEISRVAAPGARVIFRTAGTETILPGRVSEKTLDQWTYLAERSDELGRKDRSSIYGGFHIYERA